MVLEWTLEPTPGSILVSAAASVYISREHGRLRTTAPDILCESCACIIHTIYRAAHSTIITSEERASEIPSYQLLAGYLRTKGQESVYETCACVVHTILLSYMCINIVSHITLMFARGTCAS